MTEQRVELATGTLVLHNHTAEGLEDLVGYGSRINPKREFLFVSKVLCKHYPTRPSAMQAICRSLADRVRSRLVAQPTIVIGLAETATGLGYGVFEQLSQPEFCPESFYIHTTRYQLGSKPILNFQEEHSHAPSHLLYGVESLALQSIVERAVNIVLVDDEVTTGQTILNLLDALRVTFPSVKQYYAVSILNWMSPDSLNVDNVHFESLYQGQFSFERKQLASAHQQILAVSESVKHQCLDEVVPYNFGRFGVQHLSLDYARYVDWRDYINQSVLVLGTGECIHPAYLFGAYLEQHGVNVHVQSTTRSPALVDGLLHSKLAFKDNYGEEIDNFLYNVADQSYDSILICYETPRLPEGHHLPAILAEFCPNVRALFIEPEFGIGEIY